MTDYSETVELSPVEFGNAVLKRYATVEFSDGEVGIAIDFFTDDNIPVELSAVCLTLADFDCIQSLTISVLRKAGQINVD